MKTTLTLLLFISFRLCSAQFASEMNLSNRSIKMNDFFSFTNFHNSIQKNISPENLSLKNIHEKKQNCYSINKFYNCFQSKKNNFNPFQVQQINFTWSVLKVRFELNLIASAGGIMEKMNFIQIQNPVYQ